LPGSQLEEMLLSGVLLVLKKISLLFLLLKKISAAERLPCKIFITPIIHMVIYGIFFPNAGGKSISRSTLSVKAPWQVALGAKTRRREGIIPRLFKNKTPG